MKLFDPKAYWETRLSKNGGLQGVGYASLGKNYNEWLYKVRRNIFLREVQSLPVTWTEANVLDVGSGTGFYIQLWHQIGVLTISGSDFTNASITHLRERFPTKEFLHLDIGAPLTDLLGRRFDAISAFDVLFHIVDDRKYEVAIHNIYSMLKPGGWIILSDNFLHSSAERTTHQVSRPLGDVTSILKRAGFWIMHRRPMFILMNYPIDIDSGFWKLFWKVALFPLQRIELLGRILGATVYPIEMILTRMLHEGPSTEIMICQKLPDDLGPRPVADRVNG